MRQLPFRPDLEHYRKEAKALVRASRAGDPSARERASAILGARAAERFQLSDAQFVLAREHGLDSWAELRRAAETSPLVELMGIDRGEVVVESELSYGDGEPVRILVRKRLYRYLLSDLGRAVEKAGKPSGWREVAEHAAQPMNVDGQGRVFVPAHPRGLAALEELVERLADASRAVHEAVLALEERGS
jgi:hypothetical protein